MKKVLLMIIISVLLIANLQGCVENSPSDDQPNNDAGDKLETNVGEDVLDLDEEEIHSLLNNAIEKTISENRFMVTISENIRTQRTRENDITNDGSSINIDTVTNMKSEIRYINYNMDGEEIYRSNNTTVEQTATSISTNEVLKIDTFSEESIDYIKDGILYWTKTRMDGNTVRHQRMCENKKILSLALIENYNKSYIEHIDFSEANIDEIGNTTTITVSIDEDVYNHLKYGKSIESSSSYADMVAQFTIEDGYLVNFKVEALLDNNTAEGKKEPWSIDYRFHSFDGDFLIIPPEGYEYFEQET